MATTYTFRGRGIVVRTEGADDEPWESVSARHWAEVDRQINARGRVIHAPGQSFRKKKGKNGAVSLMRTALWPMQFGL
jgi:hypothetical protein